MAAKLLATHFELSLDNSRKLDYPVENFCLLAKEQSFLGHFACANHYDYQ